MNSYYGNHIVMKIGILHLNIKFNFDFRIARAV